MRVGIDIGGTFTDVITVTDEGDVGTFKIPSTPTDPSEAVLQALSLLSDAKVSEVIHGSTVATNTILERKGAKTALLTTDGFRDNIYIQRQNKTDVYSPRYQKPVPVVTRDLVLEVGERVAYTGEVLIPMDVSGLRDRLEGLIGENGIRSIAVCFLHAYKNPAHEIELAKFLETHFPDVVVTISSEVLPEFREYERTSTTVLSAYLKPVVSSYIDRIESGLDSAGARFLVMQSSGGTLLGKSAKRHPAQMFLSGPAAGVTGAVHVGLQIGSKNLFTLDIGGTSTDVALITGGRPSVTTEMLIDGLPIALSMIDIGTIGAGGGSIAWLDDGGMLRVGPQSAGAEPGPACYGKGGQEFTVTDALVTMGLIRPDLFLGGEMQLDVQASLDVAGALCTKLDLSPEELAESVFQINLSSVTRAMRLVSIERGYDPRDYTLCAFGGGGPLHAALVAEDLGVDEVIVPPHAGLFSAYGLLVADFRRDYVLTEPMQVLDAPPERIREILAGLRRDADEEFVEMGIEPGDLIVSYSAEMRYVGQGHDLNVPFTEDDLKVSDLRALKSAFDGVHLEKYGHNFPEDAAEFVSFRAQAVKHREKPDLRPHEASRSELIPQTEGSVVWKGQAMQVRFIDRRSLARDASVAGPAVVVEATSTTLVPPGWHSGPDAFGNLWLSRAVPNGE